MYSCCSGNLFLNNPARNEQCCGNILAEHCCIDTVYDSTAWDIIGTPGCCGSVLYDKNLEVCTNNTLTELIVPSLDDFRKKR